MLIRVGGAEGYDVVVAPGFAGLGDALAARFPRGRCVLVTNPIVGSLHARVALDALSGWDVEVLEIPDGESRKDTATWLALVEALLVAGVDRRTPVLALGGGVTGDVVGFAAAAALRGLPLVQVPTTLLAMVDSSVGGKTGVNAAQGKNLIGAFHAPSLVWAPLAALETLSDAELRCGLGEVVKHTIIAGQEAFVACEADADAIVARDPAALARVVADSVRTKARIVEADPTEKGVRAILNLGHTLGHAIEAVAGFGELRHGEAVALGLLAMTRFARDRGWCEEPSLPERVERLLQRLGLPTDPPPNLDARALAVAVGFDKKRQRGNVKVVVPVAVGRVELRSLPLEEVPGLVASLTHHRRSP